MRTICLVIALSVAMLNVGTVLGQAQPTTVISQKKGVGLAEKNGLGEEQLAALNVSWFYNWGTETNISTNAQFVPMIFSLKKLNAQVQGDYVLGYNEPDKKKQSNISVEDALESWPTVVSKAKFVGSPAVAGNAVEGDWLPDFMQANPKVDFVTAHWYKGVDPELFIKYLEDIHEKYGKPVWVTEFAPQTIASSRQNPDKYTKEQVNQFISRAIQWMESTPWVERYAWHDSSTGTSALFDENGELTTTGRNYANSK